MDFLHKHLVHAGMTTASRHSGWQGAAPAAGATPGRTILTAHLSWRSCQRQPSLQLPWPGQRGAPPPSASCALPVQGVPQKQVHPCGISAAPQRTPTSPQARGCCGPSCRLLRFAASGTRPRVGGVPPPSLRPNANQHIPKTRSTAQ